MKHLDHEDMVANILAVRAAASPEQVKAGTDWYPTAGRIAALIAEATGTETERVAMAISALSPRNPWRWNVADAYAYASARAEGRTMPTASTFTRNRLRAWQALGDPGQPWSTAALKVRAFVAAIMGDSSAVVVDTWAARVATGGKLSNGKGHTLTDRQYRAIEAAYRQAAAILGEEPSVIQAITWLVAQTEGLARHAQTYKAGTPECVKEWIGG